MNQLDLFALIILGFTIVGYLFSILLVFINLKDGLKYLETKYIIGKYIEDRCDDLNRMLSIAIYKKNELLARRSEAQIKKDVEQLKKLLGGFEFSKYSMEHMIISDFKPTLFKMELLLMISSVYVLLTFTYDIEVSLITLLCSFYLMLFFPIMKSIFAISGTKLVHRVTENDDQLEVNHEGDEIYATVSSDNNSVELNNLLVSTRSKLKSALIGNMLLAVTSCFVILYNVL